MHKIWALIKTDFKNEFSYPGTWIFFLLLPILFTLIIGAALGGSDTSENPETPPDVRQIILAVDEDQTAFSRAFIKELEQSDSVRLILSSDPLNNTIIQENDALGWFEIPQGFEDSLLDNEPLTITINFGQSSYGTIAAENEIRSALNHTQAAITVVRGSQVITNYEDPEQQTDQPGLTDEELAQAAALLNEDAMYSIVRHQPGLENSGGVMMGFNQSSSGQIVTWTLITLIGGAVVFASDRENGTFSRINTTPTSKFTYFMGKLLSRFLMGMIQMSILVLFGMFILKVNWGSSPFLLLLFLSCFGWAGTSLGIMLGAFVKTSKQANSLTPLFSMLMAALGGAWWPLEITPPSYQTIVRIFPSTWAMLGFNDIIVKGQSFSGVLPEMLVLLGFALLFSAIGIWKLSRID